MGASLVSLSPALCGLRGATGTASLMRDAEREEAQRGKVPLYTVRRRALQCWEAMVEKGPFLIGSLVTCLFLGLHTGMDLCGTLSACSQEARGQRDRSIDLSSSGRHEQFPRLDLGMQMAGSFPGTRHTLALHPVSRRRHSLPGRRWALPRGLWKRRGNRAARA